MKRIIFKIFLYTSILLLLCFINTKNLQANNKSLIQILPVPFNTVTSDKDFESIGHGVIFELQGKLKENNHIFITDNNTISSILEKQNIDMLTSEDHNNAYSLAKRSKSLIIFGDVNIKNDLVAFTIFGIDYKSPNPLFKISKTCSTNMIFDCIEDLNNSIIENLKLNVLGKRNKHRIHRNRGPEIFELIGKSYRLYLKGKFELAIKYAKDIISSYPEDCLGYRLAGINYLANLSPNAIRFFETSNRYSNNATEDRILLSSAYYLLKNDPIQAQIVLKINFNKLPFNISEVCTYMQNCLALNQFDKIKKILKFVEEERIYDITFSYILSFYYYQIDQMNKSLYYANLSLEIDANSSLPYVCLGFISLKNKKYMEAIDKFHLADKKITIHELYMKSVRFLLKDFLGYAYFLNFKKTNDIQDCYNSIKYFSLSRYKQIPNTPFFDKVMPHLTTRYEIYLKKILDIYRKNNEKIPYNVLKASIITYSYIVKSKSDKYSVSNLRKIYESDKNNAQVNICFATVLGTEANFTKSVNKD